LLLDSRQLRVVGIMPPDFRSPGTTPQPDVIVAVRLDPTQQFIGSFDYQALGRLAPGVTQPEARADLERMTPIWLASWPILPGFTLTREAIVNARITPVLRPLHDDLVGAVATTLWVLMGAIGAVLLVACANIANLMLVRADGRRQEFAVRAALGAGAARIARELIVESLVVGAAGGVLGLLLAYAGLEALVALGPSNLPRLEEIAVHPPVLAFTVAVSLASTLLFGSITALKHALHIDVIATAGTRGSSASRQRSATRNTLVVVQVALALVLAVGAGLMIRTFQELRDVEPGFRDAATVQTASLWMPPALFVDPQRGLAVQREILDAVAALPGITSVGLARQVPLDGNQNNAVIVVEGQEPAAGQSPPARRLNFVSPGYFETLGTKLVAGRHLTWADIEAGGAVALISEGYARELATEPAAALGLRLRVPVAVDDWREVIGVVEDVHETGLYQAAPSIVYWPALARNLFGRPAIGVPTPSLVVRSERAGDAVFRNEILRAIQSVNPDIAAVVTSTLEDLYAGSLARTSFTLVLLAIAGGMALVLGVIGIYGVVAYVVAQRTREIGIRSALGAQPRDLKRMFLRQGLALGAIGAAVGLVAAALLGRSMSALLFGVSPLDPVAYLTAVGVVVLATALATYVPARRAATVDPMRTLKAD
jgi:predicted permease